MMQGVFKGVNTLSGINVQEAYQNQQAQFAAAGQRSADVTAEIEELYNKFSAENIGTLRSQYTQANEALAPYAQLGVQSSQMLMEIMQGMAPGPGESGFDEYFMNIAPEQYATTVLNALQDPANNAMADYLNNPLVKQSREELLKASNASVENSAAARGTGISSRTLKDLQTSAQGQIATHLLPQLSNIYNQTIGQGTQLANEQLRASVETAGQSQQLMFQSLSNFTGIGAGAAQNQAGVLTQLGDSIVNQKNFQLEGVANSKLAGVNALNQAGLGAAAAAVNASNTPLFDLSSRKDRNLYRTLFKGFGGSGGGGSPMGNYNNLPAGEIPSSGANGVIDAGGNIGL